MTSDSPRLVIEIPIEDVPTVVVRCNSEDEKRRVVDWLNSNAELADLVDAAMRVSRQRAHDATRTGTEWSTLRRQLDSERRAA